ncbi:hypothetical protein [Roseateles sp.]|uniref:hypothetical protein n=1 Tax=Roseateles sp. TaxID=1971397 RepID=UPI0031D59FD8
MKKRQPLMLAPREHVHRGLPDNLMKFSFRLLQTTRKFGLEPAADAKRYLQQLLSRLQAISSLQVNEFRASKAKALRAHRHRWLATTEAQGFPSLSSEWDDHEAWQFQLSANEHGRVHGILVDEVFYVVWLDPEHRLYQ